MRVVHRDCAALLLLPLVFIVARASAAPAGACPAGIATACSSDGSQTCCPIFMSQSGWGCCNLPGASCCPASSTTQGCCPSGTTCVPTGEYSATCVPSGGGSNISATQVCTPGARYPPSSTLPSVIQIGDSVSEGYQPVVTQMLSKVAFVQHSPWSVGGGADDVGNGLNCEEAFLRTAMYEPAQWDVITFKCAAGRGSGGRGWRRRVEGAGTLPRFALVRRVV